MTCCCMEKKERIKKRSAVTSTSDLQLVACWMDVRLWCSARPASLRSSVPARAARPPESRTRRRRILCASAWRGPSSCWWTWWARREEMRRESCPPSTRTRCCRRKLCKDGKINDLNGIAQWVSAGRDQILSANSGCSHAAGIQLEVTSRTRQRSTSPFFFHHQKFERFFF